MWGEMYESTKFGSFKFEYDLITESATETVEDSTYDSDFGFHMSRI